MLRNLVDTLKSGVRTCVRAGTVSTFDQQHSFADILVMSGSHFVCHDLRRDYQQVISCSCREGNRVPLLLIGSRLTSRRMSNVMGEFCRGLRAYEWRRRLRPQKRAFTLALESHNFGSRHIILAARAETEDRSQ
jgi:hypothetical protein